MLSRAAQQRVGTSIDCLPRASIPLYLHTMDFPVPPTCYPSAFSGIPLCQLVPSCANLTVSPVRFLRITCSTLLSYHSEVAS